MLIVFSFFSNVSTMLMVNKDVHITYNISRRLSVTFAARGVNSTTDDGYLPPTSTNAGNEVYAFLHTCYTRLDLVIYHTIDGAAVA